MYNKMTVLKQLMTLPLGAGVLTVKQSEQLCWNADLLRDVARLRRDIAAALLLLQLGNLLLLMLHILKQCLLVPVFHV